MDPKFQRSAESQAKAYAYTARLEAAEKAVRDHPMTKTRRQWDSVTRSYDIWIRNLAELQDVLKLAEENEQVAHALMSNVGPRDAANEFFKVLDQRLHNMIAAAISLVDHARILSRDHEGQAFKTEFDRRTALILAEPRTWFLKDLRNFLLHKGQAPIQGQTVIKGGTVETKILLGATALLAGWDWSALAKRFIKANPKGVHLSAEIATYASDIEKFYQWMFDQYEHLHAADIDAVNLLISERNLALSGDAFKSKEEFDAHAVQAWAEMKAREGETQ